MSTSSSALALVSKCLSSKPHEPNSFYRNHTKLVAVLEGIEEDLQSSSSSFADRKIDFRRVAMTLSDVVVIYCQNVDEVWDLAQYLSVAIDKFVVKKKKSRKTTTTKETTQSEDSGTVIALFPVKPKLARNIDEKEIRVNRRPAFNPMPTALIPEGLGLPEIRLYHKREEICKKHSLFLNAHHLANGIDGLELDTHFALVETHVEEEQVRQDDDDGGKHSQLDLSELALLQSDGFNFDLSETHPFSPEMTPMLTSTPPRLSDRKKKKRPKSKIDARKRRDLLTEKQRMTEIKKRKKSMEERVSKADERSALVGGKKPSDDGGIKRRRGRKSLEDNNNDPNVASLQSAAKSSQVYDKGNKLRDVGSLHLPTAVAEKESHMMDFDLKKYERKVLKWFDGKRNDDVVIFHEKVKGMRQREIGRLFLATLGLLNSYKLEHVRKGHPMMPMELRRVFQRSR